MALLVRRLAGAFYLLLPFFMERILNLLGLDKSSRPIQLPCIVRFTEGGVQVSVLEIPLPCGHSGYGVSLEYHLKESDEWVPIGFIRDFALDESISVLLQAKDCIASLQQE